MMHTYAKVSWKMSLDENNLFFNIKISPLLKYNINIDEVLLKCSIDAILKLYLHNIAKYDLVVALQQFSLL